MTPLSLATLTLSLALLLASPAAALDADGSLLLSFKYAVLADPLSVLSSWSYDDPSPCSWNGVVCMAMNGTSRVISLRLPGSQLAGPLPPELALVEHLRHLDLSGNALNGTLPAALFNATELRVVELGGNELTGSLPDFSAAALQTLNLSGNALTGGLPRSLALQPNLTVLALSDNYLSGGLPAGGFDGVRVLDLSLNLINGTLPPDLAGGEVSYLNLSYNKISGEIPPEMAARLPAAAAVDLSFNNLTGEVPDTGAFRSGNLAGNPNLCGSVLGVLCSTPSNSTPGAPANSPPAIAVIPKYPSGNSPPSLPASRSGSGGLRPATIAGIVVADMAGVALLFFAFIYIYRRRQRRVEQQPKRTALDSSSERGAFACCVTNRCGCGSGEGETTDTDASETEGESSRGPAAKPAASAAATLVTMDDGEAKELEMEALLGASAYILGASGPTIVYKAVLEDGSVLAVRRIGESSAIGKMREFEAQVRAIARLRHPNLLGVRGFYWAADEKLLLSDFAPNGSLANVSFTKKLGSSPFHLRWDARLRIARGVARGLAFLHDKRCVHGNLKPSNILLAADMEPWIADFGLDRLILAGEKSGRAAGVSARHFGSKRSMLSQGSLSELSPVPTPSPGTSASSAAMALAYQAPESLQNLKPTAKWDVFSFGVVLLELLSGRLFPEAEVSEWNAGFVEERSRIARMADPSIRGEVEGREEALLCCFKLGFSCVCSAPQRRPSMREALQILERVL